MFTVQNITFSSLSLMAVFGMAACSLDATAVPQDETALGTSEQALTGGSIPDDTHYSSNMFADGLHSRSSLKTYHQHGNCKLGGSEEVYKFEANYASQGLTAKGTLTVKCSDWTVKAVTSRNTYSGSIQLDESGIPYTMYWHTSVGVTWQLNWN